jgi:hypothetical protein
MEISEVAGAVQASGTYAGKITQEEFFKDGSLLIEDEVIGTVVGGSIKRNEDGTISLAFQIDGQRTTKTTGPRDTSSITYGWKPTLWVNATMASATPMVVLACSPEVGVSDPGQTAVVSVDPPGTVATLRSSNPQRVSFAEAEVTGVQSVRLIVSEQPSDHQGDTTLTASVQGPDGSVESSVVVTVIKLDHIEIRYPLRDDQGGTFTTQEGENLVEVEAITCPDNLRARFTEWSVTAPDDDNAESGNPSDPSPGSPSSFCADPPLEPAGRAGPLRYKVKASLLLGSAEQVCETFAIQDQRDQLRQEYIDMSKRRVPDRGEFVDVGSYVDPGNFPFAGIRGNSHYAWVLFSIAPRLEAIRSAFGHPMNVNSAYRNPRYNVTVSGAAESQHIYGTAADIGVRDFNNDGAVNGNIVDHPQYGQVGDDWLLLALAAVGARYIEPFSITGTWVHMDWR